MFSIFKSKMIPSARELAIMIPLGAKRIELEETHRAEKDLIALHKEMVDQVEKMIATGVNAGAVNIEGMSEKAVVVFKAELSALGYTVEHRHRRYIDFSVAKAS
jgi:hypothetical protein